MFKSTVLMGFLFLVLGVVQPALAGYYTSIDMPEETRYSRDFGNVFFPDVLTKLRSVPFPLEKELKVDFPMHRRYLFIEAIARDPAMKMDTLEQKLNYSSVLIRRGKADEAVQVLKPLAESDDADHFLVLSHYATALFLASNNDFKRHAGFYMKKALTHWPKKWEDVKAEQKPLLHAFGWEETALNRNREYEKLFKLLIDNRLDEDKRRDKKIEVKDTLDPIFRDANEKPIRFLNDQGNFEPGRITTADKERLPRDAIEAVEQLLIWMPDDKRLLWLLGEVLNASAMEHQDAKRKNEAILSALSVFKSLNDFTAPTTYGVKEAKERLDELETWRQKLPPPDDIMAGLFPKDELPGVKLTNDEWWRLVVVVFLVGFAIGIFALWQFQEVRRRRQGRARF